MCIRDRSLRALHIYSCAGITDLAPLQDCKNLRVLVLRDNPYLSNMELAHCKSLKYVFMKRCLAVEDFSPLSRCTSLSVLHLGRAPGTTWSPPCTAPLEPKEKMGYLKIIKDKVVVEATPELRGDPFDLIGLQDFAAESWSV
eukprot:TRINITY_DN63985_c0_g1_i1.p1 TRINITY_DN63985_c0_g1~~TRINITY_DN63985_c0_g1_i1.p1  ORF type:complete len:142 (+),score=32.52 TRINITY_DN63985_c0_g1_i1:124-549(+)